VIPEGKIVNKGTNSDMDSYSAFFDNKKLSCTELESILRQHGVTDAFVCGLALDLCVGEAWADVIKPF
jgi:nicotinamidase/pyrazinamidase